MMRTMSVALAACGLALFLWGCTTTPPTTGYVPPDEPGVMTVELDDHDYDLAATDLAKELLKRVKPGYVVALGPIDTRDTPYSVQVGTIQESLMVIFDREGTIKFTLAVDATHGAPAAAQIYRIIEHNWFKSPSNPWADPEDLAKFGRLAKVNGLLCGRVSSLDRRLPKGGKEVTYRFVWKMADTETGVLQFSHETKIRKNVR